MTPTEFFCREQITFVGAVNMRIAILESIIMPAGHEVEFDRLLVEELQKQGYETCFFVPQKFPFKVDYGVDVEYLQGGEVITYAGAGRLKKIWLSILREKRRIAWFNAAHAKAQANLCDAIIIPTATYRYLRTLHKTKLKDSPIPIYFLFHGINPGEKNNFLKQAYRCSAYKNIHLRVITLRNDFANNKLENLRLIEPPVFTPPASSIMKKEKSMELPLKIGFFGQFRKEKNLAVFLQAFVRAHFNIPVKLIVQGATTKIEDGTAFAGYAQELKSTKI